MKFTHSLIVLVFVLSSCARFPKPTSMSGGWAGLPIEIWANTDLVQPGDTIKLRATVTNRLNQLQVFDLDNAPIFDIVVRQNGVYTRWSDGKPLTRDLTHIELKPGESKTIEFNYTTLNACCDPVSAWPSFISNPRCPECLSPPGVVIYVKYYPFTDWP